MCGVHTVAFASECGDGEIKCADVRPSHLDQIVCDEDGNTEHNAQNIAEGLIRCSFLAAEVTSKSKQRSGLLDG